MPVPKYPIIPEKKMGDDASAELSEMSSYAKDGSLWVCLLYLSSFLSDGEGGEWGVEGGMLLLGCW